MIKLINKIALAGDKKILSEESGFYVVELNENCQITLAAGTNLQLFLLSNPGVKKFAIKLDLERDSSLEVLEIVLGNDNDRYIQNWKIVHKGQNAKSRFFLKSVMKGKSELDFMGDVFIPESGRFGDTYLKFQSLLLSSEAHSKAIPALEIIANEVKAGHAASIGRVDDELLFYLESRGFNKAEAEQMLVEAFLKDGLKELSSIDEEKMLELERILMEKIDGGKVYSS